MPCMFPHIISSRIHSSGCMRQMLKKVSGIFSFSAGDGLSMVTCVATSGGLFLQIEG